MGRRYVDQLLKEVSHVSIGNYSSQWVIVFSSVVLQRDRSVRKGPDVRRVIGRRLDMWQDDKFNLLIQEAIRCDKSLVSKRRITESYMSSVFTRLMLQGKVKSASGGCLTMLEIVCYRPWIVSHDQHQGVRFKMKKL